MTSTFDADWGFAIQPVAAQAVTSAGDAAVWVAPVPDSATATSVLRFTTTTGQPIEVRLTTDDLAAIHQTTGGILRATPADINRWLDQAAGHIQALTANGN